VAISEAEEIRLEYQYANSNRNLAAGLGGTSVAMMTFFLFFGFDRAASGQIDSGLFQITLGFIIFRFFSSFTRRLAITPTWRLC
jgi:hypothetical protein